MLKLTTKQESLSISGLFIDHNWEKMMLKCMVLGLTLAVAQVGFAAAEVDALNLGGQYKCDGYDQHDGGYKDDVLTLTPDVKQSDFAHNFGAYHFQLAESDGTVAYLGEVAASGNSAAVYFENVDPKKLTDRGVGIATITHDRDQQGRVTTVLHKFYYEPAYQGGGNGSETCVKQEAKPEAKP